MVGPDLTVVLDSLVDESATAAPPGACLAIGRTESTHTYATGYRQVFDDAGPLARPLPMTAGTAHDLGSVTKLVATTAAVLTLVDRGQLDLADQVRRYLGGWPHPDTTVADLLEHRAGLWEWWPTYLTAGDPAAALELVTRLPLRYPPRSGRHYSDLGFMLLAQVVQVVAGQPLEHAAWELVFEPLGLNSLRYAGVPAGTPVAAGAPGDVVERRMIDTGTPYPVGASTATFHRWRSRVRVGEVDDGNAYHAFRGVAGHAGLFGTGADLVAFGRCVLGSLRGDGYWRAPTVHRFLTIGADPGQASGFRRWQVHDGDSDVDAYGHTGFPGIGFAVLPNHGLTVALLTNRLHVTAAPPPAPYEARWLAVLETVARAARSGRLA
ncbi:MAG: serine hydrolase [Streptosporangiales bacterium]|nr:serine hydrolase [Streptosporangiales bacterium]